MIVIMNLHFFFVILWLAYLIGDIIRMICVKISIIVKVCCVRNFGFRIGRKMKKEFNIKGEDGKERKVKQMMLLPENVNNQEVTVQAVQHEDNDQPGLKNNFAHVIEQKAYSIKPAVMEMLIEEGPDDEIESLRDGQAQTAKPVESDQLRSPQSDILSSMTKKKRPLIATPEYDDTITKDQPPEDPFVP